MNHDKAHIGEKVGQIKMMIRVVMVNMFEANFHTEHTVVFKSLDSLKTNYIVAYKLNIST